MEIYVNKIHKYFVDGFIDYFHGAALIEGHEVFIGAYNMFVQLDSKWQSLRNLQWSIAILPLYIKTFFLGTSVRIHNGPLTRYCRLKQISEVINQLRWH